MLLFGQRNERSRHDRRDQKEQRAPVALHAAALTINDVTYEMANAPGIVRTQAHTTRPAMPQRTADRRRVAPTPTIAPVMVCVVETGMPADEVKNSVAAAADSAQT